MILTFSRTHHLQSLELLWIQRWRKPVTWNWIKKEAGTASYSGGGGASMADWTAWRPFSPSSSRHYAIMNGVYFALRSGDELCNLWHNLSQMQLIEKPGEWAYLQYTEDISKNHPGGLKGRKQSAKVVVHYETANNPSRCFVRLYKLYQSTCKCPPNHPASAFYLKPLKNPTGAYWFAAQPIGHRKLNSTVAHICTAAGINGFKINYSLCATAATCLYQAGVEQIIMETTGYKSTDGVRSYKRTSTQQKESVSDILSLAKWPELDLPQPQSDSSYLSPPPATLGKITTDSFKHMFTFNYCSDLKINVQFINK